MKLFDEKEVCIYCEGTEENQKNSAVVNFDC